MKKTCKICQILLSKDNAVKYGGYFNSYCKKCDAKKQRAYYAERKKKQQANKWF